MDRALVKDDFKWDLSRIYKDRGEVDKDIDEVVGLISEFSGYKEVMNEGAEGFYKTMELYFKIDRMISKLYSYSSMLFDTDTSDNVNQALSGEISNLVSKFAVASYFVTPNIMKLDYSTIEEYYKKEPKLLDYEILLKREFRYKEHSLGLVEQNVYSKFSDISGINYETYELLKDSDMSFDKIHDDEGDLVDLTEANYSVYIESKKRSVRAEAFHTLYKSYKQFINTFASCFYGNVKEEMMRAKVFKFSSTIEASLYRDNVNVSIYNNLIDVINKNMGVLFKYYDLKREVLGLDELHLYDIYTPIVSDGGVKYDYEDAKEIVLDCLSVFGDEYVNVLREGYDNRWVDVYPTNSKRSGAYSGGSYDTDPYILLNYQGKYDDVSTLAHESGHSMHSYYTRANNSYIYGDYSIFVAEVASTVNELLLAQYMLKNSDKREEKLYILDKLMNLFKATIYRQVMFCEFERDMHRDSEAGKVLTADYLSSKYYDLNKKYFGDYVVVDDEIRYEWARIPHFYYDFYVYKYATGLSAAVQIVKGIMSGDKSRVDSYLEFLRSGSTKDPIDLLRIAGVDLRDSEVVMSAISMFDSVIDEFRELYNS